MSLRESILNQLLTVIGGIGGIQTSARNLDRIADTKLPSAILFDGDETAFENLRATSGAQNMVVMEPVVIVSLGDVPENVGTVTNDWLAKVQKAVLFDPTIASLAGGAGGRSVSGRGARYMAATTSLSEGRTSEVNLSVHFAINYPFNPADL